MSKNAATVAIAATAVVGVGALVLTGALAGDDGVSAPGQSSTPSTSGAPDSCGGWFQDFDQCRVEQARAQVERVCSYDPSQVGPLMVESFARQCEIARQNLASMERLHGMPKSASDLQISPVTAPYAAPTERICLTYEDVNRVTGEVVPGRCVVRVVTT